jgi:hypothetical protein
MAEELDQLGLSGKGASDAFRELGVAIKNADGSMRTSDAVLLDISRKFATMPDGVAKTTLAMKLFGRGGAEMIPMLNMGGDAIERLKSRMTTEFAAAADQYSDKLVMLGGRIGKVGFDIAEKLLPTIEAITDALAGFFTWVDSQGPGVQNLVTGLTVAAVAFAFLSPLIGMVTNAMIANSIATNAAAISAAASGTAAATASVGWAALLGPIGLVILAVAAVGAAFVLAWQNFKWFRDGLTTGWQGIVQGWQGAFTLLKGILAGDSALITKGWNLMMEGIKKSTAAGFEFARTWSVWR